MKSKWQGLILAIFLLTSLAACSSSSGAGEKNRPAREEARPAANKAARRKNAAESAGKTAETKEADKTGKRARSKEIQADKTSTIASAKEASGKARCLPRVKSQIVLAADYDADAYQVQGRLLAALVQNLAQVKQQAVRLEVAADPGCHRYFQPELPGRQTAYLYVEYADGFEYLKRVLVQVKARPEAMAEQFAPDFAKTLLYSPAELEQNCTPPAAEADPEFAYGALLAAHQRAKLPEGTEMTLTGISAGDFATPGLHEGVALVRYPDRSLDQVPVRIKIPLWGQARQTKLLYQNDAQPLPARCNERADFQALLGQAVLANYEAVKGKIHDLMVMDADEKTYEDFQEAGSRQVSVKAMFADGSVEAEGHRLKITVQK